jgi:signal transduction histidine kinase
MTAATQFLFIFTSFLLTGAAIKGAGLAWRQEHHPVDAAMRVMALLWTLCLLGFAAQFAFPEWMRDLAGFVDRAEPFFCQLLFVAVGFFLLSAAGAVPPWAFFLLTLQATGGLGLLGFITWTGWTTRPLLWGESAWIALNVISAIAVTALVARQVRHTHSRRSWLALAGCAMGLALWLEQAAAPQNASILPAMAHYLYAFFLFVVWRLISLNVDSEKILAGAINSFSGTTNFRPLASVSSDDDFTALALRGERQRISFELHDNIGSQLVSLLFALQAAEQPQKRFVMMSIEQCLTDLKMTVDALDSFEENVAQSLGRLRYRIQNALDRQGICMRWNVEMSDELEAVRGTQAQQVLRIAQESIANVMRHSRAKSLDVSCRFVPEFAHLLMEIRDDGQGIAREKGDRPAGHGLAGMRRRAAAVGGYLVVSSKPGEGTRVRLTLPLPHLKLKAGVRGAVEMPLADSAR